MGSPAYFGKLVNFTAASRKSALIPFGVFSPNDNLSFIASLPGQDSVSIVSVTYASALVLDCALAQELTVALTGNVASTTIVFNGKSTISIGQRLWIRYQQNATGGWTVALPSNLVADTGFAVDPGASRTTVLPIEWNGTAWVFFDTPFSVTGA